MKTNLFFTCCVLAVIGCFVPKEAFAGNLLKNGDMSSQGNWSVMLIAETPTENGPVVTWNFTGDKPAAAMGGVLRLLKNADAPQAQFALFQKLNLEAGVTYDLDGAVKVSGGLNYWLEAYVDKTAPNASADYTTGQIAGINFWGQGANVDGTFKVNAGGDKKFKPSEAGEYYVVFKIGCNDNGRYDVLLDDLFFGVPEKPEASFKVNARAGFAPFSVTFINSSVRATGYEWDFGDGKTGMEASPIHIYENPGDFTVKLNATSAAGFDMKEKKDYIRVKAFPGQLTGGGKLQGGNMQDASKWNISYLNSPVAQQPTATWNYTTDKPKAGQGGALRIQGSGSNATIQYCIYQKVTLEKGKAYRFDGAFKDLSADLLHFWSEIFVSKTAPADGADFGTGAGITQIASIGNWDDNEGVNRKLDGTYQAFVSVSDYIPTEDGDYYFVFKTGITDWEGKTFAFDILIDELIFVENPKPKANFTADIYKGFAPFEVSFVNTTTTSGETTYLWNFGDEQTSTAKDPGKHTYTNVGKYTVSLKATNSAGESEIVKTDFVVVNEPVELPEYEKLYHGNMENDGMWYTATLGAAAPVTLTWNYTENIPTGGEGGALRLQSNPGSGKGSNIALYQPVTVKKGYMYDFSGLYKAIGNTNNLWVQTFMTPARPNDTNDPEKEDFTLGQLNTWADGSVKTYDGPISGKAQAGKEHKGDLLSYHHTGEDGALMYFVIKMGTWEGSADIVLDNLSLKELPYARHPKAKFSAEETYSATAPFTVQFWDESDNAGPQHDSKWLWEFGDGKTSDEQDPEHTYAQIGKYTVSLTVTNGAASDKCTYVNYIRVGVSGIEQIDYAGCVIQAENGQIKITSERAFGSVAIYDIKGMLVESAKPNAGNYVSGALVQGIYILKVDGKAYKVAVR